MRSLAHQKVVSNHPTVEALLSGKQETITLLYDDLFPKIVAFVQSNSGKSKDAEELFHDALFQIIVRAKLRGILIQTSFEGYFFTVCKNLWYKELNNRKKKVRNEGVFELKDKAHEIADTIIQQERWELFEAKIAELPEKCCKLLLDYFKKVPYETLVKKYKYASVNTAFQSVFKCKKKLMNLIKSDSRYKNLKL